MLLNYGVGEDSWESLDCRRSHQSIPKEISPEYLLEGLMLKLKLQYFDHLMLRADSWKRPWCWERLGAGEEAGNGGRDGWMASLTEWTWIWANFKRWWRSGKPSMLQSVGSQSQTWFSDLTADTILHTQENNMRHIKYISFLKKHVVSKLERPSEIIYLSPCGFMVHRHGGI